MGSLFIHYYQWKRGLCCPILEHRQASGSATWIKIHYIPQFTFQINLVDKHIRFSRVDMKNDGEISMGDV